MRDLEMASAIHFTGRNEPQSLRPRSIPSKHLSGTPAPCGIPGRRTRSGTKFRYPERTKSDPPLGLTFRLTGPVT